MNSCNYFVIFRQQKLEEQHLQSEERARTNGQAYVPSKIRDIVTKSISASEPRMSQVPTTLSEEKRLLESEVSRLEDLLSSTRAERDEISSKYLAVSERVSILSSVTGRFGELE